MAGNGLPQRIDRRLYRFADKLARPLSDSRRREFIGDMIPGLVISGHVHLTKVARAVSTGDERIHGVEKRLSGHLASEHWDASFLADELLRRSAQMITDDSLIAADLTDLSKPYAKKLEGLGRVHDGSRPEKTITSGYMVFEAFVRVGRWQLFPLIVELLKTYSGAPTGENAEILQHVLAIHQAAQGKGTWVLDRGFDREELMLPFLRHRLAFVIRQRGDRHVVLPNGRRIAQTEIAEELKATSWPKSSKRSKRWPKTGRTATQEVTLPNVPEEKLLLVAHWRRPSSEPLLLLVSPAARRAPRRGRWFVEAYLRRWGVEDATRGLKQQFRLEGFLVRGWRSIRRLLWLVAWSFFWLNLWGEERYAELRKALLEHPWRVAKEAVYLFNAIAMQIQYLLHPKPKLEIVTT